MLRIFNRAKSQTPKDRYEDIIIIGAGEVGYQLARKLSRDKKSVTVIDSKASKLVNIESHLDVRTIHGSGTNPRILEQAGIKDADVCIAATNVDDTNILVSVFASILNPKIVRLARVRAPEYDIYANQMQESGLGIQMMVNTDKEVVRTIDRLLALPEALDYAEFANGQVRMVCYKVDSGDFLGCSLIDFRNIVNTDGILVAAIRRRDTLFIPSGEDTIEKDDVVYFVYRIGAQKALLKALNKANAFFSSACIVGAGHIGKELAVLFEKKGIQVKLIELKEERARQIASELSSTLVLVGDAREKELLVSENIPKMDVFVAVTEDDETNILTCLLAKNLGIKDIVARVNKASYMPIISSIGIEHSVSPQLAAVNSFMNFLSEGKVFASVSIGTDEAEIIETKIADDSPYNNIPLKDLKIPKGILILCILRDNVIHIPQGNTMFEANDRVIVIGTNKALQMLNFR